MNNCAKRLEKYYNTVQFINASKLDDFNISYQNNAATKIQSLYRGYRTRKTIIPITPIKEVQEQKKKDNKDIERIFDIIQSKYRETIISKEEIQDKKLRVNKLFNERLLAINNNDLIDYEKRALFWIDAIKNSKTVSKEKTDVSASDEYIKLHENNKLQAKGWWNASQLTKGVPIEEFNSFMNLLVPEFKERSEESRYY